MSPSWRCCVSLCAPAFVRLGSTLAAQGSATSPGTAHQISRIAPSNLFAIASAFGCRCSRTTQRPATITSRHGRPGLENTSASSSASAACRAAPWSSHVDHQQIGARAAPQAPAPHAGRRGAAGEHARTSRSAVDGAPACGAAATLRWRSARRWPYSSRRSSSRHARVTWLSEPIDSGTPAASQPGRSAQAVAEVGLGARAQHDAGAARGHRVDLGRRRVRGVHQLPARVERHFAGQPLDRPRAGGGEAVVDLARSARPRGCGSGRRSLRPAARSSRDRRRPRRRAASGSRRRR